MKQFSNTFSMVLCCISPFLSSLYSKYSTNQNQPRNLKVSKLLFNCLAFFLLNLITLTQKINAQKLFQVNYSFFNPMIIDGTGYPGQSIGFNVLVEKFGFEVDYGFTRKKR